MTSIYIFLSSPHPLPMNKLFRQINKFKNECKQKHGFYFSVFMGSNTTSEEHHWGALIINIHSYLKMLQMLEYITEQKNQHRVHFNINGVTILPDLVFSHKPHNFTLFAKFDQNTLPCSQTSQCIIKWTWIWTACFPKRQISGSYH